MSSCFNANFVEGKACSPIWGAFKVIIQMFDIKMQLLYAYMYRVYSIFAINTIVSVTRKIIRTFNIAFEKIIGPEYRRTMSRSNDIIVK